MFRTVGIFLLSSSSLLCVACDASLEGQKLVQLLQEHQAARRELDNIVACLPSVERVARAERSKARADETQKFLAEALAARKKGDEASQCAPLAAAWRLTQEDFDEVKAFTLKAIACRNRAAQ